jgi:hypothetical protein
MILQAMTRARVNPGRVQDFLIRRFDAVDVVEANREGWYDLLCWRGAGEDSRLRLRVRFLFSTAIGGWTYRILPGDRA